MSRRAERKEYSRSMGLSEARFAVIQSALAIRSMPATLVGEIVAIALRASHWEIGGTAVAA